MKISRAIAATLLVACISPVASGQAVQLTDHTGIARAVMQGDADVLNGVFDKAKAPAEVRRTATAAVRGDFVETGRSALACRNAGERMLSTVPSAIQLTMLCNMYLSGAAIAQGDGKSWAQAITWTNDVGAPALARYQGLKGDGTDGRDMKAIRQLAENGMPPAIEGTRTSDSIKVTMLTARDGSNASLPTISISVNGKPVTALIDSGSTSNLLLTESAASRLGVKPVPGSESVLASPYALTPRSGQRSFAVLDSLTYDGEIYKHYMVGIVRGQLPFDAVIGVPLLLSDGAITLSPREIRLAYGSPCADPVPLLFQTDPYMNGRLVLEGRVNGATASLEIDSGADVSLLGTSVLYSTLRDELPPIAPKQVLTAGARVSVPSTSAPVTLTIGHTNVHIQDALFFPDAPGPTSGMIGARFLDGRKLSLDLKHGEACISASP